MFVTTGAQGGGDHGLGFASGEQGRTVGSRQDAHVDADGPHGDQITTIDALVFLGYRATHDVALDGVEYIVDVVVEIGRVGEGFFCLFLDGIR